MKIRWPGFRIIDRYIVRKFLGTYFFAIALIVVVMIVFDAAERMDNFIATKAPAAKIALYYLTYIPFMVNQFSGLFTFIAVIFFTSKMAYNTEIIAILSGGVSFKRFLWPYFLSAAAITLLSLALSLFVIPGTQEKYQSLKTRYVDSRRSVRYEPHIYRQVTPGTFVYIRNFNPGSMRADLLVLESYEDGSLAASLEAAGVRFDSTTTRWTAPSYVERTFKDQVEHFEKKNSLDTMIDLSIQELGQVDQLVKTMGYFELNEFIRQQRAKGSDMIAVLEVEKFNRWAYPMASLILTLMGVALSSRKVRGGMGLHIGVGIALCFGYVMLMKIAEEFAKGGAIPPAVAIWAPNVLFAAVAVYLYRKAPK